MKTFISPRKTTKTSDVSALPVMHNVLTRADRLSRLKHE